LIHRLGGSPALPTAVSLRGPDPTETLVDIDGHAVNSGNSGDFDLSLLDPADFSSVQLVYGVSPSSLIGPNTIDGAINIRTLEPTTNAHGLLRLSAGSFGAFGATIQATGTTDRLGYALSLHRTTTQGEVNQTVLNAATDSEQFVGSAVDGSTALGKLRYTFGRGDAYLGLTFHDQSFYKDLSAALSSVPAPGSASGDAVSRRAASADPPVVDSFSGTSLLAHNAAYGLDLRLPLGRPDVSGIARTSALLRYQTSLVSQSVFGPGADTSPFLYNDRDLIGDGILQVDHQIPKGTLTLKVDVRNEQLTTDFASGVINEQSVARRGSADVRGAGAAAVPVSLVSSVGLGQTQRSAVIRYTFEPTAKLHYILGAYYSSFSSFGTSVDPRFGFVWTPTASSALRASVGSTFQAPQLPELYVPPVLPPPVHGIVTTGNPNLKADHATDFDLGFEHVFGGGAERTHVAVDLYRTNLRAPAATFIPTPSTNPDCNPAGTRAHGDDAVRGGLSAPLPPCPLSYPVNAGDGVYAGIELRADRQIAPFTTVRAGYSVNSAYLTSVPPEVQNGTLVVGEQSLGLPLHKGVLTIDRTPPQGLEYSAGLVYQGAYNGLNQPRFATLNASLGYRFRQYELNVSATNLTNVYDKRFTYQNAGVAYGGLDGPIPTNAYALQGMAFTVSLTRRY
jgi:outer membrane receptor protein involved in Fe transport